MQRETWREEIEPGATSTDRQKETSNRTEYTVKNVIDLYIQYIIIIRICISIRIQTTKNLITYLHTVYSCIVSLESIKVSTSRVSVCKVWRHLRIRILLRNKYHTPWSDAAHHVRRLIRNYGICCWWASKGNIFLAPCAVLIKKV